MNYNLKKYFSINNFFFLLLICILSVINFFLDLPSSYIYILCFLLIATIGVSHGAYDGKKGEILFNDKFKYSKFIFYFIYTALVFLVFIFWYLNPLISLIIFLLISSLHFGKEDLEIYLDKKYIHLPLLFFLKGSLIILLPLFFNFEKTNLIFNTILFSNNYLLLSNNYVKFILAINLLMQVLFYLYIYFIKKLNRSDFFSIIFEIFLIIIIFYLFTPIVAFTLYFCFMHSVKNILLISDELNSNLFRGFQIFVKRSLFLTLITFFILLISLFFLIKFDLLENSIEKIIFISLASLTLPHIILHYIAENIKKL
ncbi:MAG: Brp/Blh family beta-carotene 15,15'-dioxygenase [Candidatus Fonsibacter sp.]|nr:Brp/Blh family beta-carotene 15,15'-dioxygenase [Candidatus Fonsibacter sp.]